MVNHAGAANRKKKDNLGAGRETCKHATARPAAGGCGHAHTVPTDSSQAQTERKRVAWKVVIQ